MDLSRPIAVSIGQAYVQPELEPLAIYAGDTPVGFLMYCVDRDDGEYWLYRLMIDRLGIKAMGYAKDALLQAIQKDAAGPIPPSNPAGRGKAGRSSRAIVSGLRIFALRGQVFGKEHIMCLKY